MKKRGQISTIIIVAIAIVFTIIIIFVIRNYFLKTQFESQYEKHIKVPPQVEPVRKYMDDCVLKIAAEGADALGQQGGYIDLPIEPLPSTPFTPLSSTLEIFPNSDFRTALWFRETPNGIKKTEIPSLESMETQLEGYVNSNINRCTQNLTAFVDEGYTIQLSDEPKADVNIFDESVDVILNYPMTIIIKELNYPLKNHLAQIKTSLGKMHKIAQQIMESENEKLFLEKLTIDQLAIYDEIPFSGVDLSCVPKIWSKTNTINVIKDVLSKNIPQVKIKGTDYILANPDFAYYEFDALKKDYPEINANLLYSSSWPTLIEVTPSSGDVMKGSQISSGANDATLSALSSIFCLSDYHFVYDIKYPILISLRDKDGNIFQFATEVIIDNNQPRENAYEQLYVPAQDYSICDYPTNSISVSTLYPKEDGTLVPLDDVDIILKCFPQTCNLGKTKINYRESILNTKAPACANSIIEARKQGFYSGKISVNTNEQQEDSQAVILEPYYAKNIIIKIIDKTTGLTRDPYDSEQVVVQLKHKATDYSAAVSTPVEEPIQLLVGDYEITSYVTGESTWPITYPEQKITKCVDVKNQGILAIFDKEKEKCFDLNIPSTQLESVIKGGVKFDYAFTRQDLSSESPIIIYTLAQPIPSSLNELTALYQSIDTNVLDPRFKYPEI